MMKTISTYLDEAEAAEAAQGMTKTVVGLEERLGALEERARKLESGVHRNCCGGYSVDGSYCVGCPKMVSGPLDTGIGVLDVESTLARLPDSELDKVLHLQGAATPCCGDPADCGCAVAPV